MKIAIFTDTYLPTINGVSYATQGWKKELEQRGHEVTVICPNADDCPSDVTFKSVEIPFYENYYMGLYPPRDHDFSDYDAVHLNSFFTVGYYGYRVAAKNDIKIISSVHTPIEEYTNYLTSFKPLQKAFNWMYGHWESYLLNKSDVMVALSDYMKNRIESETSGGEARQLSNGVDTNFFQPKDTEKFKREYNIEDKKVIGYSGRLSSEKRIDELIEFAENFNGEVLIGGDGPYREEYEKLAKADNIQFLGFLEREKLPIFYSALDLFIFPSRVENDPLTVLEANACGTPVIGADAAGLQDSVKTGKNGFLYKPGSIKSLKQEVEKGYSNLESLEKGSTELSHERSITKTVDKLIEFYK